MIDKLKKFFSDDGSPVKVPTILTMQATECGVNRSGSKANSVISAARVHFCKANGYCWNVDRLLELIP